MNESNEHDLSDGPLVFADESDTPYPAQAYQRHFKLLIVDDENEIHIMTRLVLADYQYIGIPLEFLSAYSAKEAKDVIKKNPDIACCLLDVVMESKDAGLEVARFIREDEKNTKLRIILRTGQPGKAPENDIILNYDINDYKEKTELTTQKLFTTITTALRSYLHLEDLETKTKEIQAKNIRLNEEIARRIMAESNLTKYNRSLEKMIESKSIRLKEALSGLGTAEKELYEAKRAAIVSDISTSSLETFDTSSLATNLTTMNHYRQEMTLLLEKYNTLEGIIVCHKGISIEKKAVTGTLQEIETYKRQIDLDTILTNYPEIIKDATKGIEEISRAVSDIRRFTAITEETYQKTDLTLVLKNAVDTQKKEFHAKIDIQLDLEGIPMVFLPTRHIQQALNAILKNAFQAVTSKGIISVSSRYVDPCIRIRIRDIGCGISKENLPHVCKPYFTGNDKKGKGLGLALARSIILSCNGNLDIDSTLHEGTMVTIVLPVKDPRFENDRGA